VILVSRWAFVFAFIIVSFFINFLFYFFFAHIMMDEQDADINELCVEFSQKARCDGEKVVLEPSGVQHILQTLNSHKQRRALGITNNNGSK
jgi:hypothetical protein